MNLAVIAAAFAIAGPAPPLAMPPGCMPLDQGLSVLSEKFHEHIVWTGFASGTEMIMTQSKDRRTWTLLAVRYIKDHPLGCAIASGDGGHIVGTMDSSVVDWTQSGPARVVMPE